jgi:hypothetical protein
MRQNQKHGFTNPNAAVFGMEGIAYRAGDVPT